MTRAEARKEAARLLTTIRSEGPDSPTYKAIMLQALADSKTTAAQLEALAKVQAWERLERSRRM
jgi:hypothetical protein